MDTAILRAAKGSIDCAIEVSGAPAALTTALRVVRPAGWISILGIGDGPVTIDVSGEVVNKGLRLFGVFGRRLPQTWDTVSKYVENKTVDVAALVTHHLPMSEMDRVIALMKSGECGKVSLKVDE
jgi:threonine 3-dehydrogenase